VRVPYLVGKARQPQPSLGGGFLRPRPILAVGIHGPSSSVLRDGVLDTGADDTVFPEWIATAIGLDLGRADQRDVGLVGRSPILCRYLPVELRISDGKSETYRWTAVVGFIQQSFLTRPLLGYAGFLQYFDAEFRGADWEVILTPNGSFPGTRI
jgi:hypothetical protein